MNTTGPQASGEALYRRTAWYLLLPIAGVTLVNGVDRLNVSFAGPPMSLDIGLSPTRFGLGVSVFFIAYLLFQYPHALLLRKVGIRCWLLLSMAVWGVAGILMSRLRGPGDFYTARFVLGLGEAGFAPGMTWYISQWTPLATRARAMAVALSAVPLSLVVGGPLCGVLLGMHNPLGIAPWRWMFLVSTVPNFVMAVTAALYFVDRPSRAFWLKGETGRQLEAAIAAEASTVTARTPGFAAACRDARIWLCAVVWFLVMTGAYALTYWLPQMVRQMAFTHSEALIGILSALPQAGLVAGLFLNARHSDRRGERRMHTAAGALLAGLALAVAVFLPPGAMAFALLVVTGFGLGATQGVFWALPAALGIGGGQAPVGVIAAISMAGTTGGIVGPLLLGRLLEASGSHRAGILVLAGFLILGALLLTLRRETDREAFDGSTSTL